MSESEDNNNLPRLFTQERQRSKGEQRGGKGHWAIAALILTVFALGAVIWLGTAGNGPQGPVPTITSAAGDYKKRPEDPGGRDIAHRESTVFRTLQDGGKTAGEQDSAKRVENLAARDDSGAPLPENRFYADLDTNLNALAGAGDDTPEKDNAAVADSGDSPGKPERSATGKDNDNKETLDFVRNVLEKKDEIAQHQRLEKQDPADVNKQALKTMPESKSASATDDESANAKDTQKGGADQASQPPGHYVQLGSFREKSVAKRAWQRASDEYGQVLAGVSRHIEKADLGARGTYYRVRGGPVTQARAGQICRIIKEHNKNGCLVVSPDK